MASKAFAKRIGVSQPTVSQAFYGHEPEPDAGQYLRLDTAGDEPVSATIWTTGFQTVYTAESAEEAGTYRNYFCRGYPLFFDACLSRIREVSEK